MSAFSRFDILEASIWNPRPPSFFEIEDEDPLGFALDLLKPNPIPCPGPFDLLPFFQSTCDIVQIPSTSAIRRLRERTKTELYLRSLSDRVSDLEFGFDRAFAPKVSHLDRKYKWTAEIKGPRVDRKYKWVAEAKAGQEKNFTWSAEVRGKGKDDNACKIYTFEASTAKGKVVSKDKENKEKREKKKDSDLQLVEIEELKNPGAIAIRRAFAKYHAKGKRKELSPQDAAVLIQTSFRAHLVRRSQVVRGLRELAVAKAKLKEIRALFFNFSYRQRIANDAEECQRFSEKIIVLLLTVDAIEGPDYMVRASRKSMVEELEYMLEVVDPQPPGKLSSLRRRKFDLPTGPISREMARGVAEVVQMLNDDDI